MKLVHSRQEKVLTTIQMEKYEQFHEFSKKNGKNNKKTDRHLPKEPEKPG